MTSTASVAQVTGGNWIPIAEASAMSGRSIRTLHRWCYDAFHLGVGQLAAVRVRRVGDPWEIDADDFRAYLAAAVTPRQISEGDAR